jgi:hypothetical protein
MQMKFLSISRGKVLTAFPPYVTKTIWIANVKTMITRKRGLLKKPEKTLNSPGSIFLALMRLKS